MCGFFYGFSVVSTGSILFSHSHSIHEVTVDLTGTASRGGDTDGLNGQNLLIYAIPITAIVIALIVIVAIKRRKKA